MFIFLFLVFIAFRRGYVWIGSFMDYLNTTDLQARAVIEAIADAESDSDVE